jgi:hypothetical protein
MMEQFFETLFGTKPPNDFILAWEKHNGLSSWFCDINEAADYIREHSSHDIYVGCGTSRQNMGPKKRCRADLIAGIPGLWLDLDMKDPAHKQANLPATEEEVQAILSCFPLKPTIDIHSGHGRQFWWALSEFWSFESTEERLKAASLMQRFNVMFRNHAKSLGFALDMTFDLARILRIPGTTNYKGVPAMPVLLLDCKEARYHVNKIEEIVPEISLPAILSPKQAAKAQGTHFVLDPLADPPGGKFFALEEAEPLFKASWEMKRRFAAGKGSASEYDLSLATFAFRAGWSWQEVVDLLMKFRRNHNLKPKTVIDGDPSSPIREDYYVTTLTKAQNSAINTKVYENIVNQINNVGDTQALAPDKQRDVMRANLTELFGFPCDRIIMQMTIPPVVRIETPKGSVNIGPVKNLLDQKVLRGFLGEIPEKLLYQPAKRWQEVSLALLDVMEQEYMGEDSTPVGIVTSWLQQYLKHRRISYDPAEAERNRHHM